MTTTAKPARPERHPIERLILDFAPLAVFFYGYKTHGPIFGTELFMVAIVIAMLVSRLRFGGVSALLWISGVMVLVFGGLPIWLHDPRFIQMKPTIYYAGLAAVLLFGQATGR